MHDLHCIFHLNNYEFIGTPPKSSEHSYATMLLHRYKQCSNTHTCKYKEGTAMLQWVLQLNTKLFGKDA